MKKALLNRKTFFILASIWAILITESIVMSYFDGFPLNWIDYFGYICAITLPLFIAYKSSKIISFFQEIHELNEEQYIEREGKEFYLFDASKITYYPKKILRFLRGDFLRFLRGDF